MNRILHSLPLSLLATAAASHEVSHLHNHLTYPDWMPLAAGLLLIGFSALIAWPRK